MTYQEYLLYHGKKYPCIINDGKGNSVKGYGTVCGYKDDYLVLGFNTDYEGCIASFTPAVFLEPGNFKSYRFINLYKIKNPTNI